MANENFSVPLSSWTLITASDVTALRAQVVGGGAVLLMATAGAVPPESDGGALRLDSGQAISADMELSAMFPGVAGASRVYAKAEGQRAILSVSHA